MPTIDDLVREVKEALEADKAPFAGLIAARQRFNAARRDLRAAEKAARTSSQRLTAALRALDAAGVDYADVLARESARRNGE
jgi:hypothetical protein